jgi:hypothetical protein
LPWFAGTRGGGWGRSVADNSVARFIRLFFLLMMLATISGGIIGHAFFVCVQFRMESAGMGIEYGEYCGARTGGYFARASR